MKQNKKRSKDVPRNKTKMTPTTEQLALVDSPIDEDIRGSSKPVSPAKPDILREDHPGLAK